MQKRDIIFGIHPIVEAIDSNKEFDRLFIRRNSRNDDIKRIVTLAKAKSIPYQFVPEEKLNRLIHKNHQGVVAFLASIEYTNINQLLPLIYENGNNPFIIVLDELTDVRNFGAIARTAECSGVDAIIIPKYNSVSVTGDAIKTSSGALMRIPVCRVDSIAKTIILLQEYGIKVVVASEKTNNLYTDEDYSIPIALVMGSENKGPSTDSIKLSDKIITIPQIGKIGSLNVSVATGIILYEVYRQRHLKQ